MRSSSKKKEMKVRVLKAENQMATKMKAVEKAVLCVVKDELGKGRCGLPKRLSFARRRQERREGWKRRQRGK